MAVIQTKRNVVLPNIRLLGSPQQSTIKTAQTGIWNSNCVLSGKYQDALNMAPDYIKFSTLIRSAPGVGFTSYGEMTASEGTALNAYPIPGPQTNSTTYWSASTLGCWIQYYHPHNSFKAGKYRFVSENGYTPRIWHLQGSNDGVNWTNLHDQLVEYTWDTGKVVYEAYVPVENQGYYTYHRLLIDEFDASSVRIYSWQVYSADFTNDSAIKVYASAEDPLQLSFCDGFNGDGTPKTIVKTLTSPVELVTQESLFTDYSFLYGLNRDFEGMILYALYDPQTGSVSFRCDKYDDSNFIPVDLRTSTTLTGSYMVANLTNIFDFNDSTVSRFENSSSAYAQFEVTTPFYANYLHVRHKNCSNSSSYYLRVKISEDNAATWIELYYKSSYPLIDTYIPLDRMYYVTNIRVEARYQDVYRLDFYIGNPAPSTKHEGGKVYEYDPVGEAWVQVYKVPIGYIVYAKDNAATWYEPFAFSYAQNPANIIKPYVL